MDLLLPAICILLAVACGYLTGLHIADQKSENMTRQLLMWMMMDAADGEEDGE